MDENIEILDEAGSGTGSDIVLMIRECIQFIIDSTGMAEAFITVRIIDQDVMKELNLEYRGRDSSTDILSFPQYESSEEIMEEISTGIPVHLGDLVLSPADVRENCIEFSVPFLEELPRLIIHGMLHIMGRTHMTYNQDEPMLAEQETLLKRFLDTRSEHGR